MQSAWKYLRRALIAFSPSIFLVVTAYSGRESGESLNALATALSMLQGIVLIPFIIWAWVDFRRRPEKYTAPGWLIKFLDVVPLAFVIYAFAYFYIHRNW